jgi:hypothetical protein
MREAHPRSRLLPGGRALLRGFDAAGPGPSGRARSARAQDLAPLPPCVRLGSDEDGHGSPEVCWRV